MPIVCANFKNSKEVKNQVPLLVQVTKEPYMVPFSCASSKNHVNIKLKKLKGLKSFFSIQKGFLKVTTQVTKTKRPDAKAKRSREVKKTKRPNEEVKKIKKAQCFLQTFKAGIVRE